MKILTIQIYFLLFWMIIVEGDLNLRKLKFLNRKPYLSQFLTK